MRACLKMGSAGNTSALVGDPLSRTDTAKRPSAWLRRYLWLLFIAPLLIFAERAIGANFVTRVWLRENDLPQNKVSAVLQTHDGYLWIGTYNGLARFDGVRFVCYDSGIALSPERGRMPVDLQLGGNLQVLPALRSQQQDAGAQGYLLRREVSADPLLKLRAIGGRKRDGGRDFSHAADFGRKSEYV